MKALKIALMSCILSLSANASDTSKELQPQHQDTYQRQIPEGISDPLEIINRPLFAIHLMFDEAFIKPICAIYSTLMPTPIQKGVKNVVGNLFEPLSFINYLLQGRPDKALVSFWRFGMNSTVGFLGLFDLADEVGLEGKTTGFSDTLATWGMGAGPYLVIPIIGPTSFRGVLGMVGDYYADPFNLYTVHTNKKLHHKRRWMFYTRSGCYYLVKRTEVLDSLESLQKNSLDFYSALRSVYNQKQQAHLERLLYGEQH